MAYISSNPATEAEHSRYELWSAQEIESNLCKVDATYQSWSGLSFNERAKFMRKAAQVLRQQKETLSRLITEEMGKLISESEAEVEKSALGLEFYAEHAESFLQNEIIPSDAGESFVTYQSMGTILAIMPWNFPLWQVFRFAAPALMAGNTAILKHASNVPRCALAIENVFKEAGLPENCFRSFLVSSSQTKSLIDDPRIKAVTITGSTPAGKSVASSAGHALKKSVLELGGSDPFVILEDADLDAAVEIAIKSRYMNCGQSCIAAKRFIPVAGIADEFLEKFKNAVEALVPGDPMDRNTTLAPMARNDLREELHDQVLRSLAHKAEKLTGCDIIQGTGAFYQASILNNVTRDNPAYHEELFGPVAIVIHAKDEQDALRIANDTEFGLGGSVWTRDIDRGRNFALQLECGSAFVNGLVKSDPRLPFGGMKTSGYGRELSRHGIQEFVNVKTIWIK
ncbi:MAG: NAD-dependent succinate-semialdehyde dehydrogenase [Gammaproteobacteria bacterium]|nr:NAD-dependent succinate-semialdehyde dehydrogenase [Gammaproteobacteria bacterium]